MTYLPRLVDLELDELLPGLSAIALDGPKGVGKTETARQRVVTTLNLMRAQQRQVIADAPETIADFARPVLIDEWQRVPEVWDVVKQAVDDGAEPGSFLLAGSASPDANAGIHSGAGRVVSLRMRPMGFSERRIAEPSVSFRSILRGDNPELSGSSDLALKDYVSEILCSGFPGIRTLGPRAQRAQLDSYLVRRCGRDLNDQGIVVRRPETLRSWLTAYASATATTASYNEILRAATSGGSNPPAKQTTIQYREWLTQLWLLDPLPAWLPSMNLMLSAAQAPKHFLADPALTARLLGATADSLLRGHGERITAHSDPLIGGLFEALVVLTIRGLAQVLEARVMHFRSTKGEREIDIIVERADRTVVAIEVKMSGSIESKHVRHLNWLHETIGDRLIDRLVIHTGPQAYRRPDGVGVVPLALLGV